MSTQNPKRLWERKNHIRKIGIMKRWGVDERMAQKINSMIHRGINEEDAIIILKLEHQEAINKKYDYERKIQHALDLIEEGEKNLKNINKNIYENNL